MTNKELFDIIVANEELRNHVCICHWMSGSSTIVYPYAFWDCGQPEIEIQINPDYVYRKKRYDYRFYKKFDRKLSKICGELVDKYRTRIKWYSLDPSDNSCPPTRKIGLYKDDEQPN